MIESLTSVRPVPRWVHVTALLAVASTFLLLILGQMVTSFRAGMADPVWPTEPWYLFSNYRLDFGYLVEHTHRIAGFTVGGIVSLLVFGVWWTEPRRVPRWIAVFGLLVLIAGFGEFHRGLMAQANVLPVNMRIPMGSVVVLAVGLLLVLGVALSGLLAGVRNGGIRLQGLAAIVAVMIQGLLGGFRVRLNELAGTDLAAVHGVFAQVVLSLLVLLAVLTEKPLTAAGKHLDTTERSLDRWAILLTGLIFVQIVWGALIRHNPTPLTQRLHFLTAFLAVVVAVLLLRSIFAGPAARARIGAVGWVLTALLALQIFLGVEAWMLKFGLYILPELVKPTPESAAVRTLHALVGSGILASSLVLAMRLRRTFRIESPKKDTDGDAWTDEPMRQGRSIEIAAGAGGNTP